MEQAELWQAHRGWINANVSGKIAVTRGKGQKDKRLGGKRKRVEAHFPFAAANEFWGRIESERTNRVTTERDQQYPSFVFLFMIPSFVFPPISFVPVFLSSSDDLPPTALRVTISSSSWRRPPLVLVSTLRFSRADELLILSRRRNETVDRAEGTGDCHANEFEVLPFYISTCLRPGDNPNAARRSFWFSIILPFVCIGRRRSSFADRPATIFSL